MKKINLSGVPVIFLVSFFFLLFAPVEIYASNSNDFSFDIYDMLKVMVPFFGCCFTVLFIFSAVTKKLSPGFYLGFQGLCMAAFIIMYIQGTFFSSFLPLLDGSEIYWEDYQRWRIVSFAIPICIICGLIWLYMKYGRTVFLKILDKSSFAMVIVLLLTTVLSCFLGNSLKDKKNLIVTSDRILEMSEKNNMLVLLLDMVGNPEFEKYLENHPEYRSVFDDFTCFENVVGAYKYTGCSIPYIFSGEWFEYQCEYDAYKEHAFEQSKVLGYLKAKGYSIGMYDVDIPLTDYSMQNYVNVHEPSGNYFSDPAAFLKMQLKLVGFKYFPFDLKKVCVLSPNSIAGDSRKGLTLEEVYLENNELLHYHLKNHGITLTDDNSFRYIHVQGAHPPYEINSQFEYIDNATYEDGLGSCFTLVSEILEAMKGTGIYDSSAIIIMADHGGNETRSNPILYIKGRYENHDLKLSSVPIAWGDLQDIMIKLAEGEPSDLLFDFGEGEYRERRFLSYEVLGEPMTEYIQYGEADDFSTLLPTGRVFSKK